MKITEEVIKALGGKWDELEERWELRVGKHVFWFSQPWSDSKDWMLTVGGSTENSSYEERKVKTVADCFVVIFQEALATGRNDLACDMRRLLHLR